MNLEKSGDKYYNKISPFLIYAVRFLWGCHKREPEEKREGKKINLKNFKK